MVSGFFYVETSGWIDFSFPGKVKLSASEARFPLVGNYSLCPPIVVLKSEFDFNGVIIPRLRSFSTKVVRFKIDELRIDWCSGLVCRTRAIVF